MTDELDREVAGRFAELEAVEPPDVWDAVVGSRDDGVSSRRRLFRTLVAAAAVVLVVAGIIGVVAVQRRDEPAEPATAPTSTLATTTATVATSTEPSTTSVKLSARIEPATVAPGQTLTIRPPSEVQVMCAGSAFVLTPALDPVGQLEPDGEWHIEEQQPTRLDCLPESSSAQVRYQMPGSIEPGDYVLCLTDPPTEEGCGAFQVERVGPVESVVSPDRPPDVIVRNGASTLVLPPHSYCYGSVCVDAPPSGSSPSVGSGATLEVDFPLQDWSFGATFRRAGDPCAPEYQVDLVRASGAFLLDAVGPADRYVVTLLGVGSGGGDVIASFEWTTTVDGRTSTTTVVDPPPPPEASVLVLLSDGEGGVTSLGVELTLGNLGRAPQRATAAISVTAANGRMLAFEPPPYAAVSPAGCPSPEGSLIWIGTVEEGLEAAALGPAPFTSDVVVTLDGVEHRAQAEWPADELPESSPAVRLTFDPPLPALGD